VKLKISNKKGNEEMAIDAKLVKQLRDITQAGIVDCKKALEATNGNIDQAIL